MIYLHLILDANQFESVRQSETTRALAAIMGRPHRPLNTIQKMTGIDTTPHARREIKYTKCLSKHIALVQAELRYRGVTFDENAKIIALRTLLKENNMAIQAADIERRTNLPARPEELNATYFKPLHRPAAEWGSAYHLD